MNKLAAPKADLISIQYLRGVAAMLVVFHHALTQFPWIYAFYPSHVGASGVDIFFVISGFVMTYTVALKRPTTATFLKRRAVRIVPLYWTLTTVTALLLLFAARLVDNSAFTLEHYVKSLMFWPHSNPGEPDSFSPMLKLGWTLNFEMFFYLCFAILISLTPFRRTFTLGLMFGALIAFEGLTHASAPLAFWADPIIFEFLLGCLIASLYLQPPTMRLPASVGWALMAGGAALLIYGGLYWQQAFRLTAIGVPAAMVVAGALIAEGGNASVKPFAPLHFAGDASYSIYLGHLYVVVAFRLIWRRLEINHGTPLEALGFVAPTVVAGVLAGMTLYALVERPMSQTINRWLGRPRPQSPAMNARTF